MAKKYIDADKLKAEIERLQRAAAITMEELQMDEPSERMRGELDAYDDTLYFIDSLQQEQTFEDLEEAATEFANQDCVTFISRKKGFIAGAKWQKEQMMTNEEMKCALRMEYEKGVFDTKQQMLKDAVDARVVASFTPAIEKGKPGLHGITVVYNDKTEPYLLAGDKVKIVIVKEE